MSYSLFTRGAAKARSLLTIGLLGTGLALAAAGPARAQQPVDQNAAPNDFVQVVGNNALEAVRNDSAAQNGDLKRINELVDQFVLPYVDLAKTTRLAAGQNWRKATPQQQKELIDAFKGTLIRTYSGALADVHKIKALNILPFRGEVNSTDAVVRSTFSQVNGPLIAVDYRLEKTASGWKIYDLNVEGIWLIQNYRNQFSQQISQNGIDGLIAALNAKNQ